MCNLSCFLNFANLTEVSLTNENCILTSMAIFVICLYLGSIFKMFEFMLSDILGRLTTVVILVVPSLLVGLLCYSLLLTCQTDYVVSPIVYSLMKSYK